MCSIAYVLVVVVVTGGEVNGTSRCSLAYVLVVVVLLLAGGAVNGRSRCDTDSRCVLLGLSWRLSIALPLPLVQEQQQR